MLRVKRQCQWTIAVLLLLVLPSFAASVVRGDLISEAQRLEGFCVTPYGSGSSNYVSPTTPQWAQFKAAAALFSGDVMLAESNAVALDYELVHFTQTSDLRTFLALRSRETNGAPVRPWGTYFVNPNSAVTALVAAPHPQFDLRTPLLAAEIFLKSGARGLLLAGAHRNANGSNTADPARLTNTIFHAVHEAWSGTNGANTAWQIHGYSSAGHPEFPSNCLVVLSTGVNGSNIMSTNLVELNRQLEWNGLKTYAYNDALAASDPLNLEVNEGVAGTNFDSLAATENVQGQFSRALGGTFVHAESATIVRTNVALRTRAADAIANAILLRATNPPAPASPPRLSSVALLSNQFQFSTTTERYRPYLAETRADLTTGSWSGFYSFPGDGLPRLFTNNPLLNPSGFFRVRAQ